MEQHIEKVKEEELVEIQKSAKQTNMRNGENYGTQLATICLRHKTKTTRQTTKKVVARRMTFFLIRHRRQDGNGSEETGLTWRENANYRQEDGAERCVLWWKVALLSV